MRQKAFAHFRAVDPKLASIIQEIVPLKRTKPDQYFADLVEAIICQQLSDKAGATIFARFTKLFPKGQIIPQAVHKLSAAAFRKVGTSWSKANYIKDLAQQVVSGEVKLDKLHELDDESVVRELVKIKGIGHWTAEMFLMFSLAREDVFSFGDLGLRRAMQRLYGFKKEPTPKQMENISKKWFPYRTYAARILWRSLELNRKATTQQKVAAKTPVHL